MARSVGTAVAAPKRVASRRAILVVAILAASIGGPVVVGVRVLAVPLAATGPATPVYAVDFETQALPPGTAWSVTVGTVTANSTDGSITLYEPNGSYAFSARAAATPRPLWQNGSFEVNGSPVSLTVDWGLGAAAGPASTAPSASAATPVAGIGLVVVGVVTGLLIAALVGVARRRSSRTPPPAVPSPTAPDAASPAPPKTSPMPEADDPLGHML